MRRWLALGGAAMLLAAAIAVLSLGNARASLPDPPASYRVTPSDSAPLSAPGASPIDREAKRFARYDADDNGGISRDEFLASRRKAFAKLDTNGDGKLDFEEYAAKAVDKFETADSDHNGALSAGEMATTAAKRNGQRKLERCKPDANADA